MKPSLVELVLLRRAEEQVGALTKEPAPDEDAPLRRVRGRLGGRPPVLANAVLQAMSPDKPSTSADLARLLGRERKVINEVLHRLCVEGRARKLEHGVYQLAAPVTVFKRSTNPGGNNVDDV